MKSNKLKKLENKLIKMTFPRKKIKFDRLITDMEGLKKEYSKPEYRKYTCEYCNTPHVVTAMTYKSPFYYCKKCTNLLNKNKYQRMKYWGY